MDNDEIGGTASLNNVMSRVVDNDTETALEFMLGIDAHRLMTEYKFNPYVLASSTKIRIFPHQVDEVIWGLDNPRIMIADEVGLGKTIIAALIISELRSRGLIKRLLIVVPKSLQLKWKYELQNRFDIPTLILDSQYTKTHAGPLTGEFSFVTSIDYLKQDHLSYLINTDFDMVVIDEAHKMSHNTARLDLGRRLSSKTNALILLTATPHDGRDDEFMSRIRLLDSYAPDIATSSYLWTRTIKEDVVDLDGKEVFPKRTSETVPIRLLNKERAIHSELEGYFTYLQSKVTNAMEQGAVRFLRHTYKKRASSSLIALKMSLTNRINMIGTGHIDVPKAKEILNSDIAIDFEDVEDSYSGYAIGDVTSEKAYLQNIVDKINALDNDTKINTLNTFIQTLQTNHLDAKVVIFSEYRDTLDHIGRSLGRRTIRIDGTMSIIRREGALQQFRKVGGPDILLCTDAAGEGIDMQFCNMEINYDLPWNPNKLEQRMGRIHRIGQTRHVHYYNFVVDPDYSIDGHIMKTLLEKIDQIKHAMQGRVFDVIGSLLGPDDVGQCYDKLRTLPRDEWVPKLRFMIDEIESTRQRILGKWKLLLEGHRFDPSKIDNINKIRSEAVTIDEVKRFVQTYVESKGGHMTLMPMTKPVSYTIRLPERLAQKLIVGYVQGTFDSTAAEQSHHEYLALGHTFVNKILNDAAKTHVAVLGHDTLDGTLSIFKVTVLDGENKPRHSKIIGVFEMADGTLHKVDTRSVWTYKHVKKSMNLDRVSASVARAQSLASTIAREQKTAVDLSLSKTKEKIKESRYGFFAKKIGDLEGRITELSAQVDNPHLEKVIHEQKIKIATYRKQAENSLCKIESQYTTRHILELIGVAEIVADDGSDFRIKIDDAGMRFALEHELARASNNAQLEHVQDCSKNNCGYDIKSFDRDIEVKSHAKSGSIMMTDHEWKTAIRLQDQYWLYVVENVFDNPVLTCIQNPAKKYEKNIEKIPQNQFKWVINSWR